MTSEASDGLILRVRAHLAGLEPPVRADDLSDEEVAGVTLAALEWLDDERLWLLLPERFRPPTPLPPLPPILIDVNREGLTARIGPTTRHARVLEFGTPIMNTLPLHLRDAFVVSLEEARRRTGLPPLWPATPPESPPPPR